jgi:hypothetical protein
MHFMSRLHKATGKFIGACSTARLRRIEILMKIDDPHLKQLACFNLSKRR